jgi:hypothetical protein
VSTQAVDEFTPSLPGEKVGRLQRTEAPTVRKRDLGHVGVYLRIELCEFLKQLQVPPCKFEVAIKDDG